MEILKQIAEKLEGGDDKGVAELTAKSIDEAIPASAILDDGLIAGMNVVGERFRVRDIFLPEVLLAARAMYAGMELLKPLLIKEGVPSRGKVVIGSVQGDLTAPRVELADGSCFKGSIDMGGTRNSANQKRATGASGSVTRERELARSASATES